MRKPIIVGNWKMNKTIAEAKEFIAAVDSHVTDKATFGVATSFLALNEAIKDAKNLVIAAENCHFEDNGAFTGEVSVPMLQEIGTKYCIIGHSERRQMFGDTDETVNKKAVKLIHSGITPIICCGETLEEFEAGKTEEVVRRQVNAALQGLCEKCTANVVIAYEPIWAIGTGKTATTEQAQEVCKGIRELIAEMYDDATAQAVRIQYGGSVNAGTAADLFSQADIDGGLVGGASLKAEFGQIVNY